MRRASVAKKLLQRHYFRAELMRLLHTTPQASCNCSAFPTNTVPMRGDTNAEKNLPRRSSFSWPSSCAMAGSAAAAAVAPTAADVSPPTLQQQLISAKHARWPGWNGPDYSSCYGRLCCYSYRCRCSPSDCLAATDFRTVVWFGFYTLAEKPESDVYCSTYRTRLRVCVARSPYI